MSYYIACLCHVIQFWYDVTYACICVDFANAALALHFRCFHILGKQEHRLYIYPGPLINIQHNVC